MVYLDNNATTRPADEVVRAMTEALTQAWHNPSSVHRPGQGARQRVELARKAVADLIGARPKSITFTGGGTEAIDLAIRGSLLATGRKVVVTTAIEHAAVRDLTDSLARRAGVQVRLAALDAQGVVIPESLAPLIDDGVAVVSIQWANNETGAVQPVEAIGKLCRDRRVTFHCDGTQWVGKMPTDLGEGIETSRDQGIKGKERPDGRQSAHPIPRSPDPSIPSPFCDLLSFSPHKFHGPKGVGVLYTRQGVPLAPVILGVQEKGRRGGTENVPGIVGAGAGARLAMEWLAGERGQRERGRLAGLRDRFETGVHAAVPDARVNGPNDRSRRLWNTTNIAFPRLEAEALLLLLSERGVCASAGAACSSGSLDPSPVLLAMGIEPALAHGSLRFSLSRETTEQEIDEAITVVGECVARLRGSMVS